MSTEANSLPNPMPTAQRAAATSRWPSVLAKVTVVLLVCIAIGAAIVWQSDDSADDKSAQVLIHTVERSDFESFVAESGDIDSSSNVEIRCEVKAEGSAGTTILKIVEEGTVVEAGEFLVQFDDSALQQALTQQEIVVATDDAAVIDAQAELDKSIQMLSEYKDGLFVVDQETFESALFQSESLMEAAQESLNHAERMFKRGYISRVQLKSERLAVEMSRKAAQAAKTKLKVHNEFTLERMVTEYKAEIEKTRAKLKAAEFTRKLSQQRRDEILDQIKKCNVLAPSAGQVVYANDFNRRERIVIEEGTLVRENQMVITLPDPNEMRVTTRINDSKIKLVKLDNRVTIELDVKPELPVEGVVAKINAFPFPREWYGGPIEYGTEIRITNPPPDLTPGQRAKVKIFVDRQEDVVQLPIQSVIERAGSHYCLVKDVAGAWSTRQLAIGADNGSFVVIEDGVGEGDVVALNPDLLWDDVSDDGEEGDGRQPESQANAVAGGV